MDTMFYLQDGTAAETLPESYNKFFVTDYGDKAPSMSRYEYSGDHIFYNIDTLCVGLYDVFRDLVFATPEEYYQDLPLSPQWITRAGLDSDFDMPEKQLEDCFSSHIHEKMKEYGVTNPGLSEIYERIDIKKFKYAYVADCQSLINTLQELILSCHSSFISFYKNLCLLPFENNVEGTWCAMGTDSRMVYSSLNGLFIQMYSCFDILTKLAYELEHIQPCEDCYAKLSSKKILYGDKKKLSIKTERTVFEKTYITTLIENMRNELVHNATWEMNPKVFVHKDKEKILERFVLLPDFTNEGTLVTYKNRKRFFSEGKKVNDELPKIYFEFLNRIYYTLLIIAKNTEKFDLQSL